MEQSNGYERVDRLRAAILFWASLMAMPWETAFNNIEDELERRGIVLGTEA